MILATTLENIQGNFISNIINSLTTIFDYKILILNATVILLCGIIGYGGWQKSQVYQLGILGVLGFLAIKIGQKIIYSDIDQQFMLIIVEFIGLLLLGYFIILQEEDKEEHIRFEYPTLILIAII